MSGFFTDAFFAQAVLEICPIIFAALAGTICRRVGLFNIALEGQMLVGAFAAIAGSHFTGSLSGGILSALVASTLFSALLAIGSTIFAGNSMVIGITLNLLASGLTSFLLRALFGVSGTYSDSAMVSLPHWWIPGLADLPIVGTALSDQNPLVYLSWLLVVAVPVFLGFTPMGLRLRGVGEQPDAARTLGTGVTRYRVVVTLVAGLLCGCAGLQLSLGSVTLFAENMTAGRGWIAAAAVMLGRGQPLAVVAACVLFGFADAFGLKLQGLGLPSQLTDCAPYVVTLLALFILGARERLDSRRLVRA